MSLGEHDENNEYFGLKGHNDTCTTNEELVGKLSNSVTSMLDMHLHLP